MYIGNTKPIMAGGYNVATMKRDSAPGEKSKEIANLSGGLDSVTISDDARLIANGARGLTQPLDDSVPGTFPLEMYAVPDWTAPYHVHVNQELGTSGNWFVDNYPKMAAATQAERTEYNSLIKDHYQAFLEDRGINTVTEHYNAMITDKESSEALQQEFEARVNADERLVFLMRKLGMGPFA